jgi:hypothetical protein
MKIEWVGREYTCWTVLVHAFFNMMMVMMTMVMMVVMMIMMMMMMMMISNVLDIFSHSHSHFPSHTHSHLLQVMAARGTHIKRGLQSLPRGAAVRYGGWIVAACNI